MDLVGSIEDFVERTDVEVAEEGITDKYLVADRQVLDVPQLDLHLTVIFRLEI